VETFKPNLVLKDNKVYSKISIPAGLRIFEFTGDVLTTAQLSSRHPSDVADFIQIGIDLWRSKSGTFDDYFYHSCNPNCYVKIVGHRAILTTRFAIQPGMEITWDWSSTSTETLAQWKMDCKCGYIHCRKVISGIQSVPAEISKQYIQEKMLPSYVLPYAQS
jgi:SET domain-containing protein